MSSNSSYRPGSHWAAVFAAVFTLPLLYVGGSVTTYRVGLAVPDWPQTFGENMFLYDFWNAPFGVRIEHMHRLYGAAVGAATVVLAGCLLWLERRRWMKRLGMLALALVVAQGVLGGLRVNRVSTVLAAVHGATGQVFFGLMVLLAALTGRDWIDSAPAAPDCSHLRRRSAVVLGLVCVQISIGSWLRHYGSTAALWIHGVFGAAVWVQALFLVYRAESGTERVAALVAPSRVLAATATLQILLGAAALLALLPWDGTPRPVSSYQGIVRTGHQTNSAILLATSIIVTVRAFRHLAGLVTPTEDEHKTRLPATPERAGLEWEAVA
jgi:cytochrome c oxidase assembly protein subunit 15